MHTASKYDSLYRICESHFVRIFDLSGTSLKLLLCLFKKIKHVHASVQAHGWPFLKSAVTRINMRNAFYYKLSEYAHSLQQVQLCLIHSI